MRPDPLLIILILAVTLGGYELPREVVRHANASETLGARADWAQKAVSYTHLTLPTKRIV